MWLCVTLYRTKTNWFAKKAFMANLNWGNFAMFNKFVTGIFAGALICLAALSASSNSFAQPSSNLVSDVIIVGNNRIDNKYIMDKIKTSVGQFYSENTTEQD